MAQPARATVGGFKDHVSWGGSSITSAREYNPPLTPQNHVSWGVHSELALGKKHKNSPRWMNSAPPKFSIGWAFH